MAFKLYDSTVFCAKGAPTPAYSTPIIGGSPWYACVDPTYWSTLPGFQLADNIYWTPTLFNSFSDYDYAGTPIADVKAAFDVYRLARGLPEADIDSFRYPTATQIQQIATHITTDSYLGTAGEPYPPIIIDNEEWAGLTFYNYPNDSKFNPSDYEIAWVTASYVKLISDIKAAGASAFPITIYSSPWRNYNQLVNDSYRAAFQAYLDKFQDLWDVLDFMCPNFYWLADWVGTERPEYDLPATNVTNYYDRYIDRGIEEAKRVRASSSIPIYPMIQTKSDSALWTARWAAMGYTDPYDGTWCAKGHWRYLLDRIYAGNVDGIVIWGGQHGATGGGAYTWAYHTSTLYSDWWTATQEFITESLGFPFVRPDSDIATTGWVAVPAGSYYATLDEATASDADYCYTSSPSTTFECALADVADPGTDAGVWLRYRGRGRYTIGLYQESTEIASYVEDDADLTTHLRLVSATAVATISDYTDLRVKVISGSA